MGPNSIKFLLISQIDYNKKILIHSFNPDMKERHTLWGLIIGGYFTWVSIFGINQTQVQRYLTVPDQKKVVK